jgi:hypothetical protein
MVDDQTSLCTSPWKESLSSCSVRTLEWRCVILPVVNVFVDGGGGKEGAVNVFLSVVAAGTTMYDVY